MPIKHHFVSARPDNADAGAVQPSSWNANHDLTGLLAALDALAISPTTVLTFDGSGNPVLLPQGSILTGINAALTGVPTAPTAAAATNTTQIATTAFVQTAITNLIGGAPGALNTLKELADAINDDASYAATITAALGLKAPLASPTFSGTPTVPTATPATINTQAASTAFVYSIVGARGQAKLVKSGANIALLPALGNLLTVNGVNCTVPDAGVTLAATGLTVGTLYYIYATQSGNAINALEASTTAYTIDTAAGNKGNAIKTGDANRALVGMARIITGPAFADTPAQRFVRSWHNDSGTDGANNLTANKTTASLTYVELDSTTRGEFLCWAGERAMIHVGATVNNSAAAGGSRVGIGFDSATVPQPMGTHDISASASDVHAAQAMAYISAPSEGYHFIAMLGCASASGTLQAYGDSDGRRSGLMFETRR